MSFFGYVSQKSMSAVEALFLLFLVIVYGFTMFGLLMKPHFFSPYTVPHFVTIMYALTGLWIASGVLFLMYKEYANGDTSGKIPNTLRNILYATTVFGGGIPLFEWKEFF